MTKPTPKLLEDEQNYDLHYQFDRFRLVEHLLAELALPWVLIIDGELALPDDGPDGLTCALYDYAVEQRKDNDDRPDHLHSDVRITCRVVRGVAVFQAWSVKGEGIRAKEWAVWVDGQECTLFSESSEAYNCVLSEVCRLGGEAHHNCEIVVRKNDVPQSRYRNVDGSWLVQPLPTESA